MIELPLEKYKQVESFFDEDTINYPVVMAVIEKNNPGKIWVDKLKDPTICLIIADGGYAYIGKKENINISTLLKIIDILKSHKPIKLTWRYDDYLFEPFADAGFSAIDRIQFYFPEKNFKLLNDICNRLSKDCEIKPVDEKIFKRSGWFSVLKLFYGSEENFFKHGFGLALMKDDEVISEAYVCYIGGGYVETGSITNEKYRGQGFATIVRAFLMKEVLRRSLKLSTSCNVDNKASAKVSKKLGYEEKERYQFLVI